MLKNVLERPVSCLGYVYTTLGKVGWKTRSAECGVRGAECGVRSVENVEYGKYGVWKMRSIACGNALTFLFNIKNA